MNSVTMDNVFSTTTALLANDFVVKFPEDRLNSTLSRVKRKTGVKFSRSNNIISIAGLWPWVLEAHDLLLGDVRNLDSGFEDNNLEYDENLFNEDEHNYLSLLENVNTVVTESPSAKPVKPGTIPEPVVYYEYKDQTLVGKDIMGPTALVAAVKETNANETSSLKKLIAEKYLQSQEEKNAPNIKVKEKPSRVKPTPKKKESEVASESTSPIQQKDLPDVDIKVEAPIEETEIVDLYDGETDDNTDMEVLSDDAKKPKPAPKTRSKKRKVTESRKKFRTADGVVITKSSRRKSTPQRYVSAAWSKKDSAVKLEPDEEEEIAPVSKPERKKSAAPAKAKKKRNKRGPNGERVWQCDECEYVGKRRGHLREHRIRLHSSKFQCEVCEKSFGFSKDLKRHVAGVHGAVEYKCEQCNKFYKTKRVYEDHIKSHESGYTKPTFACQVCSRSFSTKYVLATHIKAAHLGMKKSFLCPTCGRSFTQKNSYRQHANVHAGIKPYVCDICGKAFTYEKSLKEHKFLHDGVRRFKCPVCAKLFMQSTSLRIHVKVHQETRDYMCTACGKGFTQKQALMRHERIHNGDKPYSCKLCEKAFSDYSIIRRHMILIHKKDPKKWQEDIITNLKKRRDYYIEGGPGHHYRTNAHTLSTNIVTNEDNTTTTTNTSTNYEEAIDKSIKEVCEASIEAFKEASNKNLKELPPIEKTIIDKRTYCELENYDTTDRYATPTNIHEKPLQSPAMSDKGGVIKNTSMPINYSMQPSAGAYSPNLSSGLNNQDLVTQESLVSRYQQIEDMYSRDLSHQRNLYTSSSTADQMRSQLQSLSYVQPVTTTDQVPPIHSQSLHNQWVFPGYPPYYNPAAFPPYQGPQS